VIEVEKDNSLSELKRVKARVKDARWFNTSYGLECILLRGSQRRRKEGRCSHYKQ
jgi:hypothetical protein